MKLLRDESTRAADVAWSEIDPVGVEELRAILVDEVLAPEHAEPLPAWEPTLGIGPTSDDLRLPAPPIRARDGGELYKMFSGLVARFERGLAPVAAPRESAEAEARMVTLLRGIHRLESEIRDQITKSRRI